MAHEPEQDRPSKRGGTRQTNPGNFANDPERASRAGQKGGQNSGGNFANDRARASEAGRRGGQNSRGGARDA
ncbi:stress-induced protein [Pseudomonas parafulva]|uniref:Stress-induced protein n=1 Tax=Pseudomonas parafulva TaxID=157782 RepID=A0AAI8KB81_9PSED|nr:general stress protein [Pseudomonas parafulva]AXO88325.1 stress-induced protein [Pseudomonas parafulva]